MISSNIHRPSASIWTLLLVLTLATLLSTPSRAQEFGFVVGSPRSPHTSSGLFILDFYPNPRVATLDVPAGAIAFSPQGELFMADERHLRSVDLADGSTQLIGDLQLPEDYYRATSLAFLGDGRLFLTARSSSGSGLFAVDPKTGQATLLSDSSYFVALAGRGSDLYAVVGGALHEVDTISGAISQVGPPFDLFHHHYGGDLHLDFDEVGRLFLLREAHTCLYCETSVEIYEVDLEEGGVERRTTPTDFPDLTSWALAPPLPSLCEGGPDAVCLHDRFRVSTTWSSPQGQEGPGHPVALGGGSGGFWFFEPGNFEVLVKVIDACAPPWDRFWVFGSGLTDVAVTVSVEDVVSGETWVFDNPQGQAFPPIQDTDAFATCP